MLAGFRLQIIDSKLYIAGEILGLTSKHRNRNIKMQILATSHQQSLPDLDLYITTDDWPQKQQTNVSKACPVQGPVFAQARQVMLYI